MMISEKNTILFDWQTLFTGNGLGCLIVVNLSLSFNNFTAYIYIGNYARLKLMQNRFTEFDKSQI